MTKSGAGRDCGRLRFAEGTRFPSKPRAGGQDGEENMRRTGLWLPFAFYGAVAVPAFSADVSSDPPTSPWFESADVAKAPWIVGHLDFGIGARYPESEVFQTDPLGLANGFGRANLVLFGGPLNFEAEVGGWVAFEDGDTLTTIEGIGHLWVIFVGRRRRLCRSDRLFRDGHPDGRRRGAGLSRQPHARRAGLLQLG